MFVRHEAHEATIGIVNKQVMTRHVSLEVDAPTASVAIAFNYSPRKSQ